MRRHLKYLGTGALATVVALVALGFIIAIFFVIFWLVDTYPKTATVLMLISFAYFLGVCLTEHREAEAIRAEREAHHREIVERLLGTTQKLTKDDEDLTP